MMRENLLETREVREAIERITERIGEIALGPFSLIHSRPSQS